MNWEKYFRCEYHPEVLFLNIKQHFEQQTGKDYFSLFPKLDISVKPGHYSRTTILMLSFKAAIEIKVNFEIEKRKLQDTLLEIAGNVAEETGLPDNFDLPDNLQPLSQYLKREKEWLEDINQEVQEE